MATYILQKDAPDGAKAGDEYIKGNTFYIMKDSGLRKGLFSYFPSQVENNPQWFKLKEVKK